MANLQKVCCIHRDNKNARGDDITKWRKHKCDREDCTGYVCYRCFMKYDPNSHYNMIKSIANSRSGQLDKYVATGRGLIGEAIIAKVRELEIISIKLDKFNTRFDLSRDTEYGMIQSKFKIPWFADWYAHFGLDHYFDTLFFQCVSKNMKDVERLYAIPEDELYGITTISVYNGIKSSKWEKFRIDERPYNECYHSIMLYLKDKRYFGISDIKKWLVGTPIG